MSVLRECKRCGLYVPVTYQWENESPLCLGCWFSCVGYTIKQGHVQPVQLFALGSFAEAMKEEEDDAEGTT